MRRSQGQIRPATINIVPKMMSSRFMGRQVNKGAQAPAMDCAATVDFEK
jgi:hypothetical protein